MFLESELEIIENVDSSMRVQVAALCYRVRNGKPQILLATSRDTGRWIIPKGWPIDGKSASQSAEQEAWEEAGVEGRIYDDCLGQYSYMKTREKEPDLPCVVLVFPLKVKRLVSKFPERGQRRLQWMGRKKAARSVWEPELAQILREFNPKGIKTGAT